MTQQVQSISLMGTRTRMLVMAGSLLGIFTAAMDQTIVGTALPRVVADLEGLEHIAWVFTAFMVTSTTTVAVVGRLTDLFGRKPFLLLGIVILALGSALAGMSQSMFQLIVFRGVQGFGAGMIMGTAFAVIGDVFPPAQRARWTGVMSGTFAAASVIGPLLGGWITDNLSWHWVFYVNLPIGALAFIVFAWVMPSIRPQSIHRSLDRLGIVMLVMAVVPLMLAFSWGGSQFDWLSPQIVGLLVLAFVAALAFVRVERDAVEPIIPLSLFRSPVFAVIIVVTFFTAMGMFGSVSYIPLFVQSVIGTSATNSGLVTMPMMLTMSVTSAAVGQVLARTGRYRIFLVAGLAVMTAGMFMLAQMDVHSSQREATRDMVVLGIGLGFTMPIMFLVALNTSSLQMLGVTTSTVTFTRSVGGTLGVALMGSLLNGRLQSELVSQTPADVTQNVPPPLMERLQDPQILVVPDAMREVHEAFLGLGAQGQQLYDQALLATKTALAMGITYAFVVGAAITLVALVVGIFLKEVPLRKTYAVAAEGALAPDGANDHAPREAIVTAPAPSLAADPPPLEGDGPAGAAAGPTRPADP
ncbi:MAG TPA: MDR family MFS transporter [Dehalococcoidia bacterium]|nr:MDR family MFS transporter [Dehalococcoidia bacterium]